MHSQKTSYVKISIIIHHSSCAFGHQSPYWRGLCWESWPWLPWHVSCAEHHCVRHIHHERIRSWTFWGRHTACRTGTDLETF